MRNALILVAALQLGCVRLDMGRKVSDEEHILRAEIRDYYGQVAAAYAAGNAEALAGLYAPSIARPMSRDAILDWGRKFFAEHGPASFEVEGLDFERVGHQSAVVALRYRIATHDGSTPLAAAERVELVKRGRRWSVASWRRASEEP